MAKAPQDIERRAAALKKQRLELMKKGLQQRGQIEEVRRSLEAINRELIKLGLTNDVVSPWI
jgi:hypothetical protein